MTHHNDAAGFIKRSGAIPEGGMFRTPSNDIPRDDIRAANLTIAEAKTCMCPARLCPYTAPRAKCAPCRSPHAERVWGLLGGAPPYGCSTVVLIGITCPAKTDGTSATSRADLVLSFRCHF